MLVVAALVWTVQLLLTGTFFLPFAVKAAALFGKKRVLLFATGLGFVGDLIAAFATDYRPLLIGRGIAGVYAATAPIAYATTRDVFPRRWVGLAGGVPAGWTGSADSFSAEGSRRSCRRRGIARGLGQWQVRRLHGRGAVHAGRLRARRAPGRRSPVPAAHDTASSGVDRPAGRLRGSRLTQRRGRGDARPPTGIRRRSPSPSSSISPAGRRTMSRSAGARTSA
ncbi:hypothetical protein ACFXKC_29615 [Streptomyces sp. NPDC059340]|uniref:hypothetical protein n=1 Tax=Streptomyces sp. NPDC059340 TaxID=3346806 RepID=UPI0036775E78